MEGKRGERARSHDEELLLIFDKRLDRPEQSPIELLREAEVEEFRPAHVVADIETMPEGRNLFRQC